MAATVRSTLIQLLLIAVALHRYVPTTVALISATPTETKGCGTERYHKMLGLVCSNLNLREVPQNLNTDVEILDLSFNRIRELSTRSFERYDDIQYLYLFENMIQTLEANTFAGLQSLIAIDLSTNGLTTIPKELFDLPMLSRLHISYNNLLHLSYDLTLIPKPVRAPLQVISMYECGLRNIPNFGPLPDLILLNVSHNALTALQPESFAPLCSLQQVDLNRTHTPRCECHQVMQYLSRRRVRVISDARCDDDAEHGDGGGGGGGGGSSSTIRNKPEMPAYCIETVDNAGNVGGANVNDSAEFVECIGMVETRQQRSKTRSTWLWVLAGLCAFFVLFMTVLYALHRRNVHAQRMAKATKANRGVAVAATATTTQAGGKLPEAGGADGRLLTSRV